MLVLSRNKGDVIWIGDDVTITVIDIDGSRVRLGITAPRDVEIDRGEIREVKLRERYDLPRKPIEYGGEG